jgi:D-alanyl-D-alanine dipeptidase
MIRTVAALVSALLAGEAVAQGTLPAGFVYLRDVDPTIAQDIRYAGTDNFVGRPLAGYEAAECVLRRDVALALQRVQADLAGSGFALKVYDCYRPARASRAMAQWAMDGRDAGRSKRFFPRLEKSSLLAGYIASVSRHSTGTAVDVTLIEPARPSAAAFDPAATYGPCIAPAAQRAPDNSLDMGTGFDCLDVNSRPRSTAVGPEHQRRRALLMAAMAKRGFQHYHREWWHFTFATAAPGPHYDFPIRPRRAARAAPE